MDLCVVLRLIALTSLLLRAAGQTPGGSVSDVSESSHVTAAASPAAAAAIGETGAHTGQYVVAPDVLGNFLNKTIEQEESTGYSPADKMENPEKAIEEAFVYCHEHILNKPYPSDGRLYCNSTFDGWGCWNYTLAGTRVYASCPGFIAGFDTSLYAYKDCTKDGTWWRHPNNNKTWTNYTTCVNHDSLEISKRAIQMYIAGYASSCIALGVSLFIFLFFKQLQCDRITLHKNLFSSYIFNGIVWILYYTLVSQNGEVVKNNPIWCQVLHVITQYFTTCNFSWMFCEGLYLHTIIVAAFTSGKTLIIVCYVIGWCLPVITTTIYTAIRALNNTDSKRCWLGDSALQWIVFGPIVTSILVNLVFLVNIVRVLITKMRSVNSPDANQTRKAVRAIIILIPLLGLQYILFPISPHKESKFYEVYTMASAFVTSFQGLFVALIFCFFNGEVISLIKRRWGQHQLMRGHTSTRLTFASQTTYLDDRYTVNTTKAPSISVSGTSTLSNGRVSETTVEQSVF